MNVQIGDELAVNIMVFVIIANHCWEKSESGHQYVIVVSIWRATVNALVTYYAKLMSSNRSFLFNTEDI